MMEMNALNSVRLYESVYKPERSSASEPKKSAKGANKDTVALSDTAKLYKAAASAIAKIPDVRDEKVARIKAMMDNGSHNIGASQLADKILNIN